MKKTWIYILITCAISWVIAGIMFSIGIKVGTTSYAVFGMLYMLIPAAVTILLQKFYNKERVIKPLMVSFRLSWWFLVALLLPFVLVFLSLGVSSLLPDVHLKLTGEGSKVLLAFGLGILAACTANGLFALGEELGWRGYMLHHLSHWSFMKTSIFTGLIWGIWHFPLILMGHNYPQHPIIGVFFMIIFCALISPMMTYIVIKSKSVISAALFHGSMNAFAGFSLLYLVGGSDLSNGLAGYAGFIVIILTTFVFYFYDKYVTKENIFSKTIAESLQIKKI